MNAANFYFNSRGILNLISRIISIFMRFDLTSSRIINHLQTIADVCKSHSLSPTFPITAMPLSRHSKFIKLLQDQGVEFAIHGLVHDDYTRLTAKEQRRHIERAIGIFNKCGIHYAGFRSPYLRTNDKTFSVIAEHRFMWVSSGAVHWPVVKKSDFSRAAWEVYEKVLNLYSSSSVQSYRVIPHIKNAVIEIPVSMPDDEACIDRLGIKHDKEKIFHIWQEILHQSYTRGEIFVLQLHHERIPYCYYALSNVLSEVERLNPPVFKGQLSCIAEWWKKRCRNRFEIEVAGNNYNIKVVAPGDATVLCRGPQYEQGKPFFSNYFRTEGRNFSGSGILPGIFVTERSHPSWKDFVLEEGFPLIEVPNGDRAAYVLDEQNLRTEAKAMEVLRAIDSSPTPLIRLWRWPNGCRSALSVSGDIDALTIQDFFLRFLGR